MKKFKKILITTLKITGVLILLAIVTYFAYQNRWRLQKSVPAEQYPEYIVGDWGYVGGKTILNLREGGVFDRSWTHYSSSPYSWFLNGDILTLTYGEGIPSVCFLDAEDDDPCHDPYVPEIRNSNAEILVLNQEYLVLRYFENINNIIYYKRKK